MKTFKLYLLTNPANKTPVRYGCIYCGMLWTEFLSVRKCCTGNYENVMNNRLFFSASLLHE